MSDTGMPQVLTNSREGAADKRLRAGLIGCGNVAVSHHAPALLNLDRIQVIGVADPVPANREQACKALNLPASAAYDDHRALLKTGVDYAVVAVPPKFRRPIVEDCARAGVHVLSEKPLAIVPAEGRAMIASMKAADLRFGIMHNYLFLPRFVLAHELLNQGAIGTVRHISLQWLGMRINPGNANYDRRWRHNFNESGGGILIDLVHAAYMAAHLMGSPIRAVSAAVDNFDREGEQVEEFGIVHFHFDAGYVSVNMWWGQGPNSFEISGTQGYMVHFDNSPGHSALSQLRLISAGEEQIYSLANNAVEKSQSPFTDIHADFAAAIREQRAPLAPAEAGLTALEAILAAYASAATGQVVALPLAQDNPIFQHGAAGIRELEVWADSAPQKRGLYGL